MNQEELTQKLEGLIANWERSKNITKSDAQRRKTGEVVFADFAIREKAAVWNWCILDLQELVKELKESVGL